MILGSDMELGADALDQYLKLRVTLLRSAPANGGHQKLGLDFWIIDGIRG